MLSPFLKLKLIEAHKEHSISTSTLAVTLSAGGGLTPRQDSEPGQGNPEDGNGHQNLARGLAGIDCGGPLPPYAGGCIAPSQYSSACSCFGIVQATTTLNPQVCQSI